MNGRTGTRRGAPTKCALVAAVVAVVAIGVPDGSDAMPSNTVLSNTMLSNTMLSNTIAAQPSDPRPPAVGAASPSPLDREPEVVAAFDRLEAAAERLAAAADAEAAALGSVTAAGATAAAALERLASLNRQVDDLGGQVDAAFERHAENRRAYVDAAVAAYVAGMPDSLQLRAALVSDPTERSHSLALAQTVGEVFSARAAAYRRTAEVLDGDLRTLAEEQAAALRAAEEAIASLEQARSAAEGAGAARDEAQVGLDAAAAAVDTAREEARRRIAAAAERFRLGEMSLAELARLADNRTAVFDIPVRAYDAYVRAARTVDAQLPSCRISWWALAAVGRIESRHGQFGGAVILANGDVLPRIVGPALDGGAFRAIPDTDGGRWDGDTVWDRAVGPMQFIPSTWAAVGTDGNGDGVADPHNFYDAATAAARYLCRGAGGRPLDRADGLRAAALSYNRSGAYADRVLELARSYGGLTSPE